MLPFLLGGLPALLGCTAEHPPESWPADGCVSGGLSDSSVSHHQASVELDDGVALQVSVWEPSSCGGAVLLIPGGLQAGISTADADQVEALAGAGLSVVAFDPRGRGESDGEEDANGARGQDDLAALARWVASRDRVDPGAVVLFSRSFGAAMAAGALSRHDDLRPLVWLDYEGPGWLEEDLKHAEGGGPEALLAFAEGVEDTEAWWAERTPAALIGGVSVPYWRLQGIPDHALGAHLSHAEANVNGATAAPEISFNRFPITLPVTEAQLMGWAIDGGLEPEEPYVTETIRMAFE